MMLWLAAALWTYLVGVAVVVYVGGSLRHHRDDVIFVAMFWPISLPMWLLGSLAEVALSWLYEKGRGR